MRHLSDRGVGRWFAGATAVAFIAGAALMALFKSDRAMAQSYVGA